MSAEDHNRHILRRPCAGRRPACGSGTCGHVRLRTWADVLSAQGEMCWGVHASLNGEHMGRCAEALRRDVRLFLYCSRSAARTRANVMSSTARHLRQPGKRFLALLGMTEDISLTAPQLGADGCQFLAAVLQLRMAEFLHKLHSAADVLLRLA
jgi:hypothetical protein